LVQSRVIDVHAPVGVLRNEDRQADRLGQRNALAIDPGCADPGIVRAREPHDEGSAGLIDSLEVVHPRIPTVGEEQAILQRRRRRQELSLGFLVRRDLHRANFVEETAVGGMELDGCWLAGREAPGEHVAQLLLQRERRAVLDHDVLEASDRRMVFGCEGPARQLLDEPRKHLTHEAREARAGEPVVKRLVRHRSVVVVVELAP
jgi:hypothetical protein